MSITSAARVLSALLLLLVLEVTLLGVGKVADLSTNGLYRQIGGITIAPGSDHINIMHDHLDCATLNADGTRESCSVTVDGDPLVATVTHDDLNHYAFSECGVTFRDRSFDCWASTYTITSPPHVTIIDLQVSDDVTDSLKRKYFLASRGEDGWVDLIEIAAIVIAVSTALIILAWVPSRLWRRFAFAASGGAGTFATAYAVLYLFLFSTSFID